MELIETPKDHQGIQAEEIEDTVEKASSYIIGVSDYNRTDRLWPPHFKLFSTNSMNIAYGACGTSLFLKRAMGEAPRPVKDWLAEQEIRNEKYPPGLKVGSSGVAYALSILGLQERASEVMEKAYQSPLLFEEESLFLGVAGWGAVSLHLHASTARNVYLERAVEAGNHLLEKAEQQGDTCYWPCSSKDNIHYGFGHGASGISLFLYHLYRHTGIREFAECAVQGLEYELEHAQDRENGLTWKMQEGGSITYPYWEHGSAGVGTVLIRFYQYTKEERYLALARQIAETSANIIHSVLPSLLKGMSGVGEFMLDMYRFTREEKYLFRAQEIAKSVLLYRVEKPGGIAFPGRWLTRISTDYATGSGGIGLFLDRLLDPTKPRFLVDFLSTGSQQAHQSGRKEELAAA